jgi:hypothetical protein
MVYEGADSEGLGCVVTSIKDHEVILFGVDGRPMWSFTDYESVDFHLMRFC